ncbi:MAG: sulfotransferase [Sphingomonas bacterium]|nr:sulfotransferase [Sphingomonas bacterium]
MLATEPSDEQALLGMTGLLESLGRSGELEAYFDAARAAGTGQALSSLGQAIARRECGDFAGALSAIERAVSILPVGTWHQMRGELADRAGDPDTAFAAFAQMNAADAAAHPDAPEGVRRFRASLDASLAALDRPVRVEPAGEREPPLFLVGFPRSGTTLLDTFLLGHPGIEVHEERPFLDHAAALLEDGATEPGAAEVAHMRAAYWRALDAESTRRDGLHIDKFPLASARALLIHQLFPDARFVLALRHPCDVVLSCFMTRFRLNWGVAAFLSLEDAAKTYARVMRLWIASRERLGLAVLEVRYEEFVADPARVIGQVMDFAGLEDHPAMLDHQFTARRRGLITTPSYAQVLKPVTGQAVGRWKRYRAQIEPALPILEPWCAKFGYSIDD